MKNLFLCTLLAGLAPALSADELQYIQTNDVEGVKIVQTTTFDADLTANTATILSVKPNPTGDYTVPSAFAVSVGGTGYLLPVVAIGERALANARGLTSVTIPDSVLEIGDFAFDNCTALSSISLGANLRRIGKRPFVNTALRQIALPDSLLDMDGNITAGTIYNASIVISDSSHFVYSDDGVLYNRDMTKLYACPTRAEGSVTIPTSVTEIRRDAFFGCFRLTYLNLPETVGTIGEGAFNVAGIWPDLPAPESTPKLTSVFYNSTSAPAASDGIYFGAPDDLVSYVPESWGLASGTEWKGRKVRDIDDAGQPPLSITDSDKITWSYRIVDGVAEIYNNGTAAISPKGTQGALCVQEKDESKTSVRALKIPASINGYTVRSIGAHAFDGCSGLVYVGIPETVETIGDFAFANCTALKAIGNCGSADFPFDAVDGKIDIPYGVTQIGSHPFVGTKLLSMSLPTTTKGLSGNPLAGCEFLTEVTVDANNPKYTVVNGILCDKRKTTVIGVPANLNATSVTLPATVKTIGTEAFFGCAGLDGIALADSVTTIEARAFAGCSAIEKLSVPAAVTTLGSQVFSNCTALVQVTYLGDAPAAEDDIYDNTPDALASYASAKKQGWSGDTWKDRALVIRSAEENPESDDLKETDGSGITWRYRVVDGAAEIYSDGGTAISSETPITAISLPSTLGTYLVKSIGERALSNLRGITSVDVPATYESIGDFVFSNCTSLASVKLPNGIRSLGKAPFYGTAVTALNIPASLTAIDGNPLLGCPLVTDISADSTAFKAVDGVLYDATQATLLACLPNKTEVTVPASVTAIAADAFAGCSNLRKLSFLGDEPTADDSILADTPADLTISANAYEHNWSAPQAATWKSRPFENASAGQDGAATFTDESGCEWTYTVDGPAVELGAYGETPVIPGDTAGEIAVPERLANRPVTEIPAGSFTGCGLLTKITIPASVTNIAADAFNGCTSLVEIAVAEANPAFSSKNRCLYSKDGKTLVRVPAKTPFAATQTQVLLGQKQEIVEVLGAIDASTGLIQPNTIIPQKTYGTTTESIAYVFTPSLTADQILSGVTAIADHAFTDCGRLDKGASVYGSLVTSENGTVVSSQQGQFALPFSTEATGAETTTNELSCAAGFYQGDVCFYKTVFTGHGSIATDNTLTIPQSVVTVGDKAFEGSHFTNIAQQGAEPPAAAPTPAPTVQSEPVRLSMKNALSGASEEIVSGQRINCYVGVELNLPLTLGDGLESTANKVSVKGLPSGLKLVKTTLRTTNGTKTYAYSIAGRPTRAQAAKDVTITVTDKSKRTFTFSFRIETKNLPAWAVGSFNGVRYAAGNCLGSVSAKITARGKLSGKILVPSADLRRGEKVSVSASAFTVYDDATSTFFGTAILKSGKTKQSVLFSLSKGKDGTGALALEMPGGTAELVQNIWERKDLTAPAYKKGATVVVDGITFKYGVRGAVSWSGNVRGDNGAMVSIKGKSQLLTDSKVLLYVPPKANLLGGVCELITLP